MGYGFTTDRNEADLIIFNTCAVRETAELKVYGQIGAAAHIKAKNPEVMIGVCGCMAQKSGTAEHIKKKYPHVDVVFGTHNIHNLPEILREAAENRRVFEVMDTDGFIVEGASLLREGNVRASVSIMYGCNNFCTYCIVPYVRGRERSRRAEDILAEIKTLKNEGFSEVTLLGQNVNSYTDGNGYDFADLLRDVSDSGLPRIRFLTSHPKDISEKLIKVMAERDNICKQLHLPFQAGSDRVLAAMNRCYTKAQYLGLIDMVRSHIGDIALSGDVIVGFPGETDADFVDTLDIVQRVRFDMLFTFIYSKRSGTPAAELADTIPLSEKKLNFEKLTEIQNDISLEINRGYIGKYADVLAEGESKTDKNILTGRTGGGKTVNFAGEADLVGKIIPVKITQARTWSLLGEV